MQQNIVQLTDAPFVESNDHSNHAQENTNETLSNGVEEKTIPQGTTMSIGERLKGLKKSYLVTTALSTLGILVGIAYVMSDPLVLGEAAESAAAATSAVGVVTEIATAGMQVAATSAAAATSAVGVGIQLAAAVGEVAKSSLGVAAEIATAGMQVAAVVAKAVEIVVQSAPTAVKASLGVAGIVFYRAEESVKSKIRDKFTSTLASLRSLTTLQSLGLTGLQMPFSPFAKIKNFFSFKDDVMVDVTNGLLEAFNGSENKEAFEAKLNENKTISKALAKAKSSDGKRFDEEIESLFSALSKAKKRKTPVTIESLEPSALETIKAFIFGLLKYITVLPAIAEYMGKGESYLQSTRAMKVDAKERLTSFSDFVKAPSSPAVALPAAA